MRTETIELQADSPGTRHSVQVLRFGTPGAAPKAYVQAAMHADEVPAMLVAQQLRAQLATQEAQGAVAGEVVLVPFANPLGLAQQLLGQTTVGSTCATAAISTGASPTCPARCWMLSGAVSGRMRRTTRGRSAVPCATARPGCAGTPARRI